MIEVDKHPSEDAENELRMILLRYGPDHLQQAVSKLGLDVPSNVGTRADAHVQKSIEEVIDEYTLTELAEKAKTTQKDYGELLDNFSKYCIDTLPDALSAPFSHVLNRKFISGWINWRCPAAMKNSTRNKVVAFTRGFLKALAPREFEQLRGALKLQSIDDSLPRAFTNEQAVELLEMARRGGNNFRNYTMIMVFVGSGVRVSELCPLRLSDIDYDNETIKVHPKRAKNTLVVRYVNSDAFAVLRNYITYTFGDPRFLPNNDERYIFTGIGRTTPISTRTVELMIQNLMMQCKTITEADREVLSVHSFRHYYALTQLRNGVDIYTISVLLGHKSVKSTEVYLKLFKDDLRAAVNSLNLARVSNKHLALIYERGKF